MTRLTRVCRAVGVGIAVTTATLAMTQVASAAPAPPPDVPPTLVVPAGNQVFLLGHGTGVQIYQCNGTSWVFQAPRATLTGDNGQVIATHFAGPGGATDPQWKATDGTQVAGKVLVRDPVSPPPGAANIPQLLLKATPVPNGGNEGRLSTTTYIQRLKTVGGVAPTDACNATTNVGVTKEISYTADYYFWKATGNLNSKPGA
jgi:hypothetical protein